MSRIEELKTKDGEQICPVTYYNCVKSDTSVDATLLSHDIEDIKNGILGNMKGDEDGDCKLVSLRSRDNGTETLVYGKEKISSLPLNESKFSYDSNSDDLVLLPYLNKILFNASSFPKRIDLQFDYIHANSSRTGFCFHFIPAHDVYVQKSKVLYTIYDIYADMIYPSIIVINDDCILYDDSTGEIYEFISKTGYRFDFDISIDKSNGVVCLFINVCKFTTNESPVSLANPNESEE